MCERVNVGEIVELYIADSLLNEKQFTNSIELIFTPSTWIDYINPTFKNQVLYK